MPHQIDRTKSPLQNIIDLVNTGSTHTFTGSEFYEISTQNVQPYTEEPGIVNTQLELIAAEGSGFTGSKIIRYRRLEPGNTRIAATIDYEITPEDDLVSLKEKICIEHNLISSDVNLDGNPPEVIGQTTQMSIFFPEFSLIYLTGNLLINVTLVESNP
jgi:hypothetical protein